jgi:hypothetical protein
MVHQSKRVQETNMLSWKDYWIGCTRVWNLDRPLSQQIMCTAPHTWQQKPVFSLGGVSWISPLPLIILRSAVHVVGWISSHILRWPRSPVPLPSVSRIEASCRVHEVGWQHLESWYRCLSRLFMVCLDVLWSVSGQQEMLLWWGLWQLQCEQPLSQNKQILQCNPLLLFCCGVCPIVVVWVQCSQHL